MAASAAADAIVCACVCVCVKGGTRWRRGRKSCIRNQKKAADADVGGCARPAVPTPGAVHRGTKHAVTPPSITSHRAATLLAQAAAMRVHVHHRHAARHAQKGGRSEPGRGGGGGSGGGAARPLQALLLWPLSSCVCARVRQCVSPRRRKQNRLYTPLRGEGWVGGWLGTAAACLQQAEMHGGLPVT